MSCRRTVWERRAFLPRALTLALSILLIASPAAPLAAAGKDDASSASSLPGAVLAVASDPVGANVFIDGQFVGSTPLNVGRLSSGDHRVRVVKNGFLENARVVNVAAGKTSTVQVRLTPDATAPAAAQVISSTGGGGGGVPKWVWWSAIGGGAVAAAVIVATRNHAPIAGTVTVSPSTALQSATNVTFTAQGASDPDNDPLTYSWSFSDGSTGTGQTVTKTLSTSGTVTATVTVSDGKKSDTAQGSVTVRSLSGTWGGNSPLYGTTTLTLAQTGGSVSGSWVDQVPPSGTITGTVSAGNPQVRLSVNFSGFPGSYTANPSADINALNGTYSDANGTVTLNLTRR
jgi:hypothetical protein